eukprot:9877326-Heterocapsa_arctica.AAC.1
MLERVAAVYLSSNQRRRAAVRADIKRLSSGYQTDIMFPGKLLAWTYRRTRCSRAELTAGQARQKVVRLELQERTSFGALNTRSAKHPT